MLLMSVSPAMCDVHDLSGQSCLSINEAGGGCVIGVWRWCCDGQCCGIDGIAVCGHLPATENGHQVCPEMYTSAL